MELLLEISPSLRIAIPLVTHEQVDIAERALLEWNDQSKSVNVLITGRTGVGKSTLINGIVGEKVAEEGDELVPETTKVKSYEKNINGVTLKLWDSPGFEKEEDIDSGYIEQIKRECLGEVDLCLYCIRMDNPRFTPNNPDILAMRKITENFGPELWKNAVIVLTFANQYIEEVKDKVDDDLEEVKKNYERKLKTWERHIREVFKSMNVPSEITEEVTPLPAGRYDEPLLECDKEGDYWLSRLWLTSLLATKARAQPALVKINTHRLVEASEISKENLQELMVKQHIIVNKKAEDMSPSGSVGEEMASRFASMRVRKGIGNRLLLSVILSRLRASPQDMDDAAFERQITDLFT